jgi:hypothetical protein
MNTLHLFTKSELSEVDGKANALASPQDLVAYPPRFTHKQKQMVASNWLLNRELLQQVSVRLTHVGGKALRRAVEDGTIIREGTCFLVTWLDSPESCYEALMVQVSFRSPAPTTRCLPYAVVKLPTPEQLAGYLRNLANALT